MERSQQLKRYSLFAALAIVALLVALVLRGPHVSNALKKVILPELESASGRKVIAQKIYVNLFPLFIEAKDLKVFDDSGQRILRAKRVKAYLDISGLFEKTLSVRRLVVKEPLVETGQEEAEAIAANIRVYLAKTRKDALKVKVAVVEVQQGNVFLASPSLKSLLKMENLSGEIITGSTQRIRADMAALRIQREGLPEIAAGISAQLLVSGDSVTIQRLAVNAYGSLATASGEAEGGKARVSTSGNILVSSFKKIFGLQKSGEGDIRVSGTARYEKKEVVLDIAVAGSFYLETLMELLKVKDRVEGLVAFRGDIKGPLRDISARGTATMTKGNLYNVAIDTVTCQVLYDKGTMRFSEGNGLLYNGKAKASASITLPEVNYFTLDIDFENADSKPLFQLIGWDPGIPAGKVNGNLHHAGQAFDPKGSFVYGSTETGSDVLGRVRRLTGKYDLSGHILALTDIRAETDRSAISVSGTADIDKKTLDLHAAVRTEDVTDMSLPFYDRLAGSAEFSGRIGGRFDDPLLSGRITVSDAVIESYPAGRLSAEVVYRKNLLQVKDASAAGSEGNLWFSGSIGFRDAESLFDLRRPAYNLTGKMDRVDSVKFVRIFYPPYEGSGRFSAGVRLTGTGASPEVKAGVSLEKAAIYNVPLESGTADFSYTSSRLEFSNAVMRQGDSSLRGIFVINPDETFSYRASSDRLRLSDIIRRPLQGEVIAALESEGKGTFDNPSLTITARMTEGALRGKPVGKGVISASLKDHQFSASAKLINDRISISAKGRTDGIMPWEASADIQTGRYDFLVTSWLRDIPEDLILSLNGSVTLHGTRNHIEGSAAIKHIVLSMYGYSFTNEEEISLDLKDRQLSMSRIAMRSGNTLLRAGGSVTIGRSYNLNIEGSSALSPFKSLSARLGVLRGDAVFVLGISGDWETPKINGGISLANGAIGLKDYPAQRITGLNGYLYMDNDRIVLQNLAGKLGGGDIGLSGVLYLKKFAFSRFYVEAKLGNISSSISPEFSVNFGGNILYKGTPSSQIISGNIDINRARYRERVEWKSWLLQARKAEKYKAEITGLDKAELNIKITGKDNISIDNNVARAVASSDMVLRGTLQRPVLFGRLETRQGTVYFRNNEFKILHASADFADPNRLNPVIAIAAETTVKGYKIKMNLEGQLDHFNMSLASDPPLKEMDVLSLLTIGQTEGGIKGLEAGIGASEATSFVTGKMQDVIEERLRSITGLDRFQIDPYVSKITGTVEPRVTVSKRMLADKVFVTYTTAVGSKEEQVIKLEYFMNKNMSVVGVRDERGITGGDLRFRFEFR